MLSADEVGRRMLEEVKESLGLPSGTPGFIFWGQTPKELRRTMERFLAEEHLTLPQRRFLQRLLPALERQGLTLAVLVPLGNRVVVRGAQVQVVVPLQG